MDKKRPVHSSNLISVEIDDGSFLIKVKLNGKEYAEKTSTIHDGTKREIMEGFSAIDELFEGIDCDYMLAGSISALENAAHNVMSVLKHHYKNVRRDNV